MRPVSLSCRAGVVAGHVLSAENLDPVKGIYVGAYRLGDGEKANADSTFYTTKLERISRTDAFGYFCIRGMAQGRYQIVALQDGDQNFRFNQKSEQIGYLDSAITTSSYPDTRFDTLWADTITVDTVYQVPYTHFTPDRLLLRAFKEDATMLYLRKAERLYPNRFQVYFSSPSPALPRCLLSVSFRNGYVSALAIWHNGLLPLSPSPKD